MSTVLLFLAGVVIGGMLLQVITAKYIFKDNHDDKENYDKGYMDGYAIATRIMQMSNDKQNDLDLDIKEINTIFFEKFIDTANSVSACCDIMECENCPMYIDKKCEISTTPALWDMKRIEMNYNNIIKRIKENSINNNNDNRN